MRCLCLVLSALLLLTAIVCAAPAVKSVTVGDPAHPESLPAALQTAYANGARRITIKPGTYTLPAAAQTAFVLDGWRNVVIKAYGVTLVATDTVRGHDLFHLDNCDGVILAGLTLTQTQMTHYQGRVLAVGTDADGKAFCDWKPDAGYPVPPADSVKFSGGLNIADARTRLLKLGVPDFYQRPMEANGDGSFRVHFTQNVAPCVVGDWVLGRAQTLPPFKMFLKNSTHCTLQDLTLLRNGFGSIREDGGGGNRFLHCRWLPGPRPAGATENPLVCDAADGIHSTGTNPGPDIENCEFWGVLLDDCIAIHGTLYTVKSVAGAVLTLDGTAPLLRAGEPVRVSSDGGFYADAQAAAVQHNPDNTTTLTLDKDLSVPVGAKISNPNRAGAGFIIKNCILGHTRSRGILAKADNGTIENNTIIGCGQAAVSLGPEYSWNEADYVHNVRVVGNTIKECGFVGYGGAAVWTHGDGAIGNANIVVEKNAFTSNYAGDVQIEWTDGASVTANSFTGASVRPVSLPMRAPVQSANSRAVTQSDNTVLTPALYPPLAAAK